MKGPPPSDALTLAYFPPPFLSTLCTDPCLPRTHTTPWRQRRLYVGRARSSHSGATQLLLQWSTPEWAQHSSCCCTAIMLRQARRHECRTAAEHARPPTCTRARAHTHATPTGSGARPAGMRPSLASSQPQQHQCLGVGGCIAVRGLECWHDGAGMMAWAMMRVLVLMLCWCWRWS